MVKQTFLNLPDEKRNRIIEVALEEFASKPYSKASLTNIVKRAGIAKGSMYQYFQDKESLYRYLLELAAEEKLSCMRDVEIDSDGDFFETMEKVLLAGIQFSLARPQLSRIIANAMEPTGEEIIQDLVIKSRKMAYEYFKNMINKAQEGGEVRADIDICLTAHLMSSMLSEGLTNYLMDTLGVELRQFIANPEHGRNLSTVQINEIISKTMKFLKNGLAEKG